MKMFKVYCGQIEEHEVLRVTGKQVVIEARRLRAKKEEREAKESSWYSWHATWAEAHARMLADAQARVDSLRMRLQQANGDLGRIKGMKDPAAGVTP